MTPETETLAPCPFCGSVPKTGITGAPECDNWRYVQCSNDACPLRHTLFNVKNWSRRVSASEEAGKWRCFHCDEVFTTPGSAGDHFGRTPESEAGCLIDRVALETGTTIEHGRGLLMKLRKVEADRDEWTQQALHVRTENEALEGQVQSLTSAIQGYTPFRECRTIQDIFFVFDSMEGRAIAAESKLRDYGPYDDAQPVLAALSMLESDLDATDKQRRIARMAIGALLAAKGTPQ